MMNKSISLALVLLITVSAVAEQHDGPCGKFSPVRTLTHELRHCAKAAKDVNAAVSPQCCKALDKVSAPCFQAIISSGALQQVGVNPKIALTIAARCLHHN